MCKASFNAIFWNRRDGVGASVHRDELGHAAKPRPAGSRSGGGWCRCLCVFPSNNPGRLPAPPLPAIAIGIGFPFHRPSYMHVIVSIVLLGQRLAPPLPAIAIGVGFPFSCRSMMIYIWV